MRKIAVKKSELVWDEWNVEHLAKHKVKTSEAEEALIDRIRAKKGYKGRLIVFGKTKTHRLLAIVIKKTNKGYYIFSARDASKKERRYL